jgi:hypothetical protein
MTSLSVVHWRTFSEEDRKLSLCNKLLLVLPQFIGGLFFSMIYVSHGFFPALMAQIIYDMVMFSVYRKTPHGESLNGCAYTTCYGLVEKRFFSWS